MQCLTKLSGQFAPSALMAALLAAVLSGCGGGGSSGGNAADNNTSGSSDKGQVALGITDAKGDFLSYSVDVTSIKLVKANGTTVEVVPASTRIDFAQYTDVTEFFSIATVPAGDYVSATMMLDYSNADIVVENAAGDAVEAAPLDADGKPVTTLQVSIELPSAKPLHVIAGTPANMVIDFDLAASNEVTSWSPVQVTVDSVLLANVQWDGSRELRARGLLQSVDTTKNAFAIELLPFTHRDGKFGDVSVQVADTTVYHIDGADYSGATGLAALSALGADAPVVVVGDVSSSDDVRSYSAEFVYAGTSVPWAGRDAIKGTVLARNGDALIVRGVALDGDNGYESFHDDIVVNLADDTIVTRQIPSAEALDTSAISVGSRIELVGDLFAAGNATAIDTTAGRVHVLLSEVTGQINQTQPLALNLNSINRRNVDLYDFAGTGVDAASDADPLSYQIDTQSLLLSGLTAGERVMLRGFPTAFGAAPADFIAYSVTDPAALPESAHLILVWPHGSTTAIKSVDSNALIVDSTGALENFQVCDEHREDDHRARHSEAPGHGNGGNGNSGNGQGDDNNGTPTTGAVYTIAPAEHGVYSIKQRGGHNLKLYDDFAGFAAALNTALTQSRNVHQVHVRGSYNDDTGVVTAESINVVLK